MKSVYMDYNATTPLHPEVEKVIVDNLKYFGNPSSMHSIGREVKEKLDEARNKIADFIGAEANEILFSSGGSESNNTVFSMISEITDKKEIITTAIEHPCILESAKELEKKGYTVHFLNVDRYGKIDEEQYLRLLNKNTALVSIMTANNEIGTIQDIKKLSKAAHEYGALFHTDAVQAVGKILINVKDWDIDFLSFSAHKIYGPKGIGGLYIKNTAPFHPFIKGGHQEKGRRAGTENTLGILAFAKAVEMRELEMADEYNRLLKLKEQLKNGLEAEIEEIGFNGHPIDCTANTLNVSFKGAEGEAILLYLDLAGIAVSTGSACASGSLDPSHVLLASGLDAELAHGSVRFSMGRNTTAQEVDYVIQTTKAMIEKVRSMSTVYTKRKKCQEVSNV